MLYYSHKHLYELNKQMIEKRDLQPIACRMTNMGTSLPNLLQIKFVFLTA